MKSILHNFSAIFAATSTILLSTICYGQNTGTPAEVFTPARTVTNAEPSTAESQSAGDDKKPEEAKSPKGNAEPSNELSLKTERVIVFKDGYCLIIKRGTGTPNAAGEVFTDEVPDAAVLGSFWATPEKGKLQSMTADWATSTKSESIELPCRQTIDILLSNVGKTAKIIMQNDQAYEGTISEVLTSEAIESLSDSHLAGASAAVHAQLLNLPTDSRTLARYEASNFILKTEEGDLLLSIPQIRSLSIKEMTTKITRKVQSTKRTKRLTFRLPEGSGPQSLAIMYFRPGVRWIPTYRVDLSDDPKGNKAKVTMQAELLNEAEDFKNVPIDIVVGVANFRFRETPSPLILEASLRNALNEAAPQLMGQQSVMSNAIFSQRSGERMRGPGMGGQAAPSTTIELPEDLTTGSAQDLFVYSLPKTTLGVGGRTAISISTTEVPYRHVYTWDAQVSRRDNEAAFTNSGITSPLVLSKNEVWHQIILTNTSNVPWTTGAAMIMQGNQPLAQELLTYTPPKNECRVPLTVAVDIRGDLKEKEVGRKFNELVWSGHNHARIDKEATLELTNYKSIPIDLEITLRVGGKVTEATEDGKIELGAFRSEDWIEYSGFPAVNNSSTVTWTKKLDPSGSFTANIFYHFFARH